MADVKLISSAALVHSLDDKSPDTLIIDPLLDTDQIGAVSVDLRLGYDFLVSIQARAPYISIQQDDYLPGVEHHFRETRRDLGERFVLYPGQIALATTLEYLCIPTRWVADVTTRSSYTRLGIPVSTMLQPGFRGCISVELFNHGNSAIELVVGSRMFQARFFEVGEVRGYGTLANRKYYGNVRPIVSQAPRDPDLNLLRRAGSLGGQPASTDLHPPRSGDRVDS